MSDPVREGLSSQVVGANLTWHERSVRRREEKQETSGPVPIEIGVSVGVQEPHDEKAPAIWVRQRVEAMQGRLEATYEVTVLFRLQNDFPVNDDAIVRDFVRLVGFDYVLGFVRGALADGARSLGLSPPLIPTFDPEVHGLDGDDEVEGADSTEADGRD